MSVIGQPLDQIVLLVLMILMLICVDYIYMGVTYSSLAIPSSLKPRFNGNHLNNLEETPLGQAKLEITSINFLVFNILTIVWYPLISNPSVHFDWHSLGAITLTRKTHFSSNPSLNSTYGQ